MNYSLIYLTLHQELRPYPTNPRVNLPMPLLNSLVKLPMPLPNPLTWLLNLPHKSGPLGRISFLVSPILDLSGMVVVHRIVETMWDDLLMNSHYYMLADFCFGANL